MEDFLKFYTNLDELEVHPNIEYIECSNIILTTHTWYSLDAYTRNVAFGYAPLVDHMTLDGIKKVNSFRMNGHFSNCMMKTTRGTFTTHETSSVICLGTKTVRDTIYAHTDFMRWVNLRNGLMEYPSTFTISNMVFKAKFKKVPIKRIRSHPLRKRPEKINSDIIQVVTRRFKKTRREAYKLPKCTIFDKGAINIAGVKSFDCFIDVIDELNKLCE